MEIPAWVNEVLVWVPLVLILGAALVCLRNSPLSRRMPLLTLGFVALALVNLGYRIVFAMIREQKLVEPAPYFTILDFVRIVCWGLILGGLATVFADLRDRDAPVAP